MKGRNVTQRYEHLLAYDRNTVISIAEKKGPYGITMLSANLFYLCYAMLCYAMLCYAMLCYNFYFFCFRWVRGAMYISLRNPTL